MLGKIAATKLNDRSTKKVNLEWRLTSIDGKAPVPKEDNLFEVFAKLYDLMDYSGKREQFTIMIGGKSFKIDPRNYDMWQRNVFEEAQKVVTHDYSKDKQNKDQAVAQTCCG